MIVGIESLRKEFGKTIALDDVSFSFESGQVHGFIGPNGSGKTTTLRILAGLLEPTSGDAFYDDVSCAEYPEKIRPIVGYVPDVMTLRPHITVGEYLDYFARVAMPDASEREPKLEEIMEFTGVTPIADKQLKILSRGMQQRLAVGRELMHDPEVLLLDEPAAGLTDEETILTAELLLELQEEHSIIVIEHDMDFVRLLNAPVTVLNEGLIMAQGSMEEVQADEKVVEAYLGR